MVYLPVAQPGLAGLLAPSPSWIVRTAVPSPVIQKQIEDAIRSVDPLLPIATFRSLNEINLRSLGLQRFVAMLLAIAAGLTLLLAAIGNFATISNAVADRSREFGIRLALGATVPRIICHCAASGLMCGIVGLSAGLIFARMEIRLLEGLLYGIMPVDRLTFVSVGAGVLLVAAVASLAPALRIAKLDPAQTLRLE
jgi:ABC-type lipoprotein release transport system permease subunit